MKDLINEYEEELLEEWEENGVLDPAEAAFIRGEQMAYSEKEEPFKDSFHSDEIYEEIFI